MKAEIVNGLDINQNSVAFKGKYHFLNTEDFNRLCERLSHTEKNYYNTNIIKIGIDVFIKFYGDLSDLGNDIGINIGDYITDEKLGYEKCDLIAGINHGISLIDGSHP